jgi:hypothetical protein
VLELDPGILGHETPVDSTASAIPPVPFTRSATRSQEDSPTLALDATFFQSLASVLINHGTGGAASGQVTVPVTADHRQPRMEGAFLCRGVQARRAGSVVCYRLIPRAIASVEKSVA